MNKTIVGLLVTIVVILLAGGGFYLNSHHRCVDGSYGTKARCEQVLIDDYVEFGNKVKEINQR